MAQDSATTSFSRGVWSDDEHERFREALDLYPNGPWKAVADFVGTRTVRQVQTHAQKYHEKAARRLRDLRLHRTRLAAPNVLIDFEMQGICDDLNRYRVPVSPRLSSETSDPWALDTALDDDIVPSFDECIDFFLDAFSSSLSDTSAVDSDASSSGSESDAPSIRAA